MSSPKDKSTSKPPEFPDPSDLLFSADVGDMVDLDAYRAKRGGRKPGPEDEPDDDLPEDDDDDGGRLAPRHRRILETAAISEDRIAMVRTARTLADLPKGFESWGKKAVPSMVFTWTTTTGRTVSQIRLDKPTPKKDGKKARYLFGKDTGGVVGIDPAFSEHQDDTRIPALFVEGTKQFMAVASLIYPRNPVAVPFGIPGCWGWSTAEQPCDDLRAMALSGREVLICFDADLSSKWEVFDAAKQLRDHLTGVFMARSVRFLAVPGSGSTGIDDVLGRISTEEGRREVLRNLIDKAAELPKQGPRRPARASGFFDGHQFLPADCWEYLESEHHLAMAGDNSVAVYQGGVYWNGASLWWQKIVTDVLGNDYRPDHQHSLTKKALAQLKTSERVIPFEQKKPIINFRNGLLDVATLELSEHDPRHLTLVQFPFDWDPEAKSPKFDTWLDKQLPGQGDALIDVSSQMFDLSNPPTRVVFLWGPTKSGKSTYIRILRFISGGHLTSNVSLHDLSKGGQDRFASSSLFGKILNTYADLSSDDLHDTSLLKVITGGDWFEAQGKGSPRFRMKNQAMLVFSANSVPAVNEAGTTYMGRMAAFHFKDSYLGSENQKVEDEILEEAPGIVRRLVVALHDRLKRGSFLETDPGVQREFAKRSDRVKLFLSERTRPAEPSKDCILRSALYPEYCRWVDESQGGRAGRATPLGKHKFNDRVRDSGVKEFKPKGGGLHWALIWVDPESDDEALEEPPNSPGSEGGQGGNDSGDDGDSLGSESSAETGPKTDEAGNIAATGVSGGPLQNRHFVPIPPTYTPTPRAGTDRREWVNSADSAEPDPFLDDPDQTPGQGDVWIEFDGKERMQLSLLEPETAPCAPPAQHRPAAAPKPKARRTKAAQAELLPEQIPAPEPKRIVFRRGEPLPAGAIYVGRAMPGVEYPGTWGNPYRVEDHGREKAVALFEEHLLGDAKLLARVRTELAGKDLACWCRSSPCHGDVLLHYANEGRPAAKCKAKTAAVPLPTEGTLGPLPAETLANSGEATPLVVDLETQSADYLWAAPNGTGPFIRLVGTDHGVSASTASLADHAGPLVAHNGFGFDYLALAHHHRFDLLAFSEAGLLLDTMVLALALDPPQPPVSGKLSGGQIARLYRLDALAERYGGPRKTDALPKLATAYGKQQGLTGKEAADAGYGLIPRNHPDFISYLRADVAATRAVFDRLCPQGELTPYAQREMRIMGRLVAGITLAGTVLDQKLTRARYDEVEARKVECRDRLIRDYGLPTHTSTGALAKNPLSCNGGPEAVDRAAADVGLELPRTEKTDKPSTSKEFLGPLLEEAKNAGNQSQVDLLETILALTGARSVYGTALDYLQPDGRVHPRVAPVQASGRFSITAPGITVFGKRGGRVIERAIFLPDSPDHVLVAADLSQIDMRAMAAHAQDPAYLQLFEPGRDAHAEIAAAVGLTRDEAKAIGHGWNYGMSVNGMVAHCIDRALAEKFDAGMRRRFSTLVAWRDRVRERAERGQRLDNGFGRMMRPNPARAHTQAPSLMGQGTARDLMMEAVLRLPVEIVPMLRMLVHDELVFSIPLAEADRIEPLILEAMNFEWTPPGARLPVPITADLAKRGRNWADCYRKD